jgi:protein AroM
MAQALLPRGRLGVFVPLPEQVEVTTARRSREGLEVVAVPLRPQSDDAARDAAGRAMAKMAPDLVLLDCISHTRADKARIAGHVRCPILLSATVAARAAASLLPEA